MLCAFGITGSVEAAAQRRARRSSGRAAPRRRGAGGRGGSAHAVPVFVFELSRDSAVMLDAHYNARALEDMVLVVANAARE